MASAEADNLCLGALGTLCATLNTEQGRFRADRQGFMKIHPKYWPILEVDSFAIGALPAGQTSVPITSETCWIEDRSFVVTGSGFTSTSAGPLDFGAIRRQNGPQQFCTYTYVNGFANTFTTASSSVSETSITVGSVVGIYPNMTLTIWDGLNTESVTVASSWTNTSTTLTLTTPLVYAHASGTNMSALPATVKQAVIHLVVANIKQRGEGGLVINEIGAPSALGGSKSDRAIADLDRAKELLHAFIQVWGKT